jgi:ATP-binding cassette subfamily C (CFTR/MRP) protein 1
LFRLTALKAARSFHRRLLGTMLRLPMAFFDTTPLGRVLNRFSKETGPSGLDILPSGNLLQFANWNMAQSK